MPSHTPDEQRRKAIARIMALLASQGLDPNAAFTSMPGLLPAAMSEGDPMAQPQIGGELVKMRRFQQAVNEPQRTAFSQRVTPGGPDVPRGGYGADKRFDRLFGALQIAELQAAAQGKDFRFQPFGQAQSEPASMSLALEGPLPLMRPQIGASVTGQQQGASVTGQQRGASVTGGILEGDVDPAQSAGGVATRGGLPVGPLRPEEEFRLRQAMIQQAEAATRQQEAAAAQQALQARMADPLEKAKMGATTQQFQSRRDVGIVSDIPLQVPTGRTQLQGLGPWNEYVGGIVRATPETEPQTVRGVRQITEGDIGAVRRGVKGITLTDQGKGMPITALQQQAEMWNDPNRAAALKWQASQLLTGGSPGVSQALVQQQTAQLRDAAAAARRAAADAAALARVEVQQQGATGRTGITAETQRAIAAARERINLLKARTEASRYDSEYGGFGGLSDETEQLLRDAEADLNRLQAMPTVQPPDNNGVGHKEGDVVTSPSGRRGRVVRNQQTGALEVEPID